MVEKKNCYGFNLCTFSAKRQIKLKIGVSCVTSCVGLTYSFCMICENLGTFIFVSVAAVTFSERSRVETKTHDILNFALIYV